LPDRRDQAKPLIFQAKSFLPCKQKKPCKTAIGRGLPSRFDEAKPLISLEKSLIYHAKPLSDRVCLADLNKQNL